MTVGRTTRINNFRRATTWALTLLFFTCGSLLQAVPVVSTVSPTQGKPGNQVAITGSGFSTVTLVQFGAALADFVVSSDTRMTATVPLDATTGPIRVTNPTGTGASSATFVVAPRITSFSPYRSATNTVVLLEGFNLIGTTNVLFNDQQAAFSVTASTQIQATVPTGATNGPITVRTPAGTATTTDSFIVTGPEPIIDSFSPNVGAPGTSVLIYGANFRNPVTVKYNGTTDDTATATAATLISSHAPASTGTNKITISTSGGTTTSTTDFIVTSKPVITNFFPTLGVPLRRVTIEGVNLANTTGVGFDGKPASWEFLSANQLSAIVPAAATNSGPITVTNAFGSGVSAENFIVTRAPIIDGFTPVSGNAGTPVAISGANLSNGPTVLKFNGVNAPFVVTGQNGIQIQAAVPTGASSGAITMSNAFGSFTTSSNFFVPGSAPYIRDLSPGSAPRGTIIVINGGNFSNPVTVKFNGVSSPTATATALTQIQATVPASATSGPLTVTTDDGTSTNNPTFYVPPRLASFTPSTGVVGGTVVISGANFTDAYSVLFDSAVANFTVTPSNSISAVIPSDATSGPLSVTTPGGVIISTDNFRVLPNITSFSPSLGPAGTLVTISGTSFFNVTNVTFNNASATVFTVVSASEVRATVPAGATTGPIRVSTPDGTAASSASFAVTRPSDLAVTMTASATLVQPGQSLTYGLVITNRGPSIVTGVTLTDTLPSGVILFSTSSSRGSVSITNSMVTYLFGVFTNGTSETATIVVTAPSESLLYNTAKVASVEPDLSSFDNTASALTAVLSDASRTLRIDLLPGRDKVVISWPNSPVSFTNYVLDAVSPTNVWLPAANTPFLVNGRYTVTNDTSGGKRFFRLQGP